MTKQACFVTPLRAALSAARRCSGRTPGAGACTAGRPVVSAPTGFATRHANGATPSLWPPTRPRSAGSWPPSSARPEGGDRGASQHPILSSLKSLHRQRFSSTAGTRPRCVVGAQSISPMLGPRRLDLSSESVRGLGAGRRWEEDEDLRARLLSVRGLVEFSLRARPCRCARFVLAREWHGPHSPAISPNPRGTAASRSIAAGAPPAGPDPALAGQSPNIRAYSAS